jgi:hypothetical protein
MICKVGIEQTIGPLIHFSIQIRSNFHFLECIPGIKLAFPLFTQKIPPLWPSYRTRFESQHPLRQSNFVV